MRAPEAKPTKTEPNLPLPNVGRRFPVPWGLFVALGVYALAVLLYVRETYWKSPEYQAAEHYQATWRILGKYEGKRSSQEELTEAYRHLLEAARLKPEIKTFHDELEELNWRFDEKKWEVPPELRMNAEAVAMLWTRIQQQQKPILVVGVRDKGWAPDQLLAGPETVVKWSLIPAALMIVFWGYTRFSARSVREKEREEELQRQERELTESGRFRERLAAGEDDDEDDAERTDPGGYRPPPVAKRPAPARKPKPKPRPPG